MKNSGFSILEMGISVTIIALIIAGITVGSNLKEKLEINQMIEDIGNVSKAVEEFKETYGALPGDMFNAQDMFGAANTSNGNGDNDLADASEDLLFWQHLALAGLIEGTYDGSTDGVGGRMEAPITKGIYDAIKASASDPLHISVTKIGGATGLFTTVQAYNINTKYDDSDWDLGIIRSVTGGCFDDQGSAGDPSDDTIIEGGTCDLYFYLEE